MSPACCQNYFVMFPPVTDSKQKWKNSTRRISLVKLPIIKHVKHESDDYPVPPDPEPSRIIPSLCIDNRYFMNYTDEEPNDDCVEYMTNAFRSFSRIHGDLNRQRRNYFEKRGLENAIQLNINQQNEKINQAIECLAICEQITKKYNCSLNNSFQILIDEFATKCFKLSSITAQLHALAQTHSANLQVRKNEQIRQSDIEWRIEREQLRIKQLDDRISDIYANRERKTKKKPPSQ